MRYFRVTVFQGRKSNTEARDCVISDFVLPVKDLKQCMLILERAYTGSWMHWEVEEIDHGR